MNKLRKNEIYTAEITGMSTEGQGVCKIEGCVVFVKGTLIGETWTVRITKVNKTHAFARAEECLKTSPNRLEPVCKSFGVCGGCTYMHMTYEAELQTKLDRVNEAFKRLGGLDIEAEKIIGSNEVYSYRNKAVYNVAEVNGEAICGFYRPRSHDVVKLERCHLQTLHFDEIAKAVCDWMNKNKIRAFNDEKGIGFIRHIYLRKAQDGRTLVCVTTFKNIRGYEDSLVQAILAASDKVCGVVLNINKSRGNTVLDGRFKTLWGDSELSDTMNGYEFSLAPQAFYQINPKQAEKLYNIAIEMAEVEDAECVDLYCGAGTISMSLAKVAKRVVGAEIVEEAVINASENAERNGVTNVEFICADAGEVAKQLSEVGAKIKTVVVDPPRKGMSEEAIRGVVSINSERIVYVSCDPASLSRDLKIFEQSGYKVRRAVAVDMFPRTTHVECVTLLTRE